MLDVYSLREGEFELVDLDVTSERSRKVRIYNLIRFGLVVTGFGYVFAILFALGSQVTYGWTIIALPILLSVVLIPAFFKTKEFIPSRIGGLLLRFNQHKEITSMRVQRWQPRSISSFVEEEVRYNQSIGFKVVWRDNGDLEIELIVDPDYPGTEIFETLTFHTLAQFIVTMELCIPDLDKWYYRYDDESEWNVEVKSEINDEIMTARPPWQIRDYFDTI